jgi:hypothetical protein
MDANPISYDGSAIQEYFRIIREHVIQPLQSTALGESCFGSAMLIFAAVDGLGTLTHPDEHAKAGVRFKAFLPRIGAAYQGHAKELWRLRNALVHSAMNVASFMSKAEEARGEHLQKENGFIFLHTRTFLEDFRTSVDQLEQEVRRDTVLFRRIESRLEWGYIDPWRNLRATATLPPAVGFVHHRR